MPKLLGKEAHSITCCMSELLSCGIQLTRDPPRPHLGGVTKFDSITDPITLRFNHPSTVYALSSPSGISTLLFSLLFPSSCSPISTYALPLPPFFLAFHLLIFFFYSPIFIASISTLMDDWADEYYQVKCIREGFIVPLYFAHYGWNVPIRQNIDTQTVLYQMIPIT